MRAGKVFGLEAAGIQQSHSQCIPHGQLGRGAGRWGQIERASFFFDRAIEHHIGMLCQRGLQTAGHGNERHPQAFEHGQYGHQFIAFAAVRDRQHHIDGLDHAQITVTRLARMDKHGGGAGRGQGGGNFAANVPTLAHARHDHTALDIQHHIDGLHKPIIQAGFDLQQGRGLDVERLPSKLKGGGGLGEHGLHFIGHGP